MSASVAPPVAASPRPTDDRPIAVRGPRLGGWLTPLAIVIAVIAAGVVAVMTVGGSAAGAHEIAQAVNLHLSDLPGYEVAAKNQGLGASILPKGLDAGALSRCRGLDVAARVGEVNAGSPWFRLSAGLTGEAVMSGVSIERSRAVTAGDLALLHSRRALACITQGFGLGTRIGAAPVPGASVSGARVRRITAPVDGADGSLGLRFVVPIDVRGVTLRVDMDWFAYRVGRDELSLITFAINHPFVPIAERQLASTMIARARSLPH